MKNKLVLILLFVLPIAIYLIFSTATHNSLFLPTISKANADIPANWVGLNQEKISMKDKITVLGFVGNNVIENRGNFFNLNQKIYNKYKGFKDFQMVMVTTAGNEAKAKGSQTPICRNAGSGTRLQLSASSAATVASHDDVLDEAVLQVQRDVSLNVRRQKK
jgi:hypothetical protein